MIALWLQRCLTSSRSRASIKATLMATKTQTSQLVRSLVFWIPALPLAYFAVASRLEVALLSFLALGVLFLALRPFTASIKEASFIVAGYVAVVGFLGFSQPLFNDSTALYSAIVILSTVLQPFIFLFILDGVIGLLARTKRLSDVAAVVLLWLATFAGVFGTGSLVHGDDNVSSTIFLLFIMPWLVNGFVFFVASEVIVMLGAFNKHKLHERKPAKRRKKKA